MGGLPGSGGASPGGAMTRSADEAQMETEPIAKRPRIERPEGHFYPVSALSLGLYNSQCLIVTFRSQSRRWLCASASMHFTLDAS